MITSITYILYITISIGITIFVSRTLSRNGEIYLIDGFNGNVELAKSVNHMLVVGFYLLNIGFVLLHMRVTRSIVDLETMIVYLSSSIGVVLLVLGVAHFFNMFVITKMRKTGQSSPSSERASAALSP